MNYALIDNGLVSNVIVIYEGNAAEFQNAVPLQDIPAQIGDAYADGSFTRDGVPVRSPLEDAEAIIAELDAAVVELMYQNLLYELEG